MDIKSSFTVPLNRDDTWRVLLDIPRIAPCMPGARLTRADEEARNYEGEVQVRLGPVMLTFAGKARIVEVSDTEQTALVTAEGRDKKGRGSASAEVAFGLEEVTETETRVDFATKLNLSGSIAQYGRGSGMINDLANHLIGQFAENLRRELASSEVATEALSESAAEADQTDATSGSEDTPKPQAAAAPISGFRLAIMLFKNQIRRLFGVK
jgi:carbon monoxide dehydrogenase subunit G